MSITETEIPNWLSELGFESVISPVDELIIVISGQFEETNLPFNGWLEVECVDCLAIETLKGSVSEFGEYLSEKGWSADSLIRSTAICRACTNAEDPSHYSQQYGVEEVL